MLRLKMKVVVAMSGGVDSSVAAYLLKERGFEVVGLSFELWDERERRNPNICCSQEAVKIARDVARRLGIEHDTVDVRYAFFKYVIEGFCDSYISGITPNPCIPCNKFIKFEFLLRKAEELGAEMIATGHYARIVHSSQLKDKDSSLLLKGIDPKKDQSYVLYVMTQRELSKAIFPLGELKKDEVRDIAKEIGLINALRPESQEICFVGNGKYVDFIKDVLPEAVKPGPIVNMDGKVIGEHKGLAHYTIGQRKRLGISASKPLYVVGIQRKDNTIVVGRMEDAMKKTFMVKELNWIFIESLQEPLGVAVKVRSTMKEEPAKIIPVEDQKVMVEFDELQWAPAPGQSAVFYDGDIVIGGGVIV